MTTLPFETYRLELTPLSPVHIGSGESIEPYEYVLLKEDGNTFLIAIHLPRLIADLDANKRRELDDILDRGDFLVLRRWLHDHADPNRYARFRVQVQNPAAKAIRECIDHPDRAGRIELMCRRADNGVPYIPGSSIKGALRTAVVDRLLGSMQQSAEARHAFKQGEGSTLEAVALRSIKDKRPDLYKDPFRQIAITDIELFADSCYIDQVQIVRPNGHQGRPNAEQGIQIYRDMTWSLLDNAADTYVGEVRHYTHLGRRLASDVPVVARSLSIPEIIKACREYYLEEVERQLDIFPPRGPDSDEIRETLLKATRSLRDHECIVRIGRHSHFECVVFSRPFNKPPSRGYGRTRTYAGGTLPLGWVKLGFVRSG